MSDIIFALKSKKNNLTLKLESCVKQDSRGVNYYLQSKLALDMLELNSDDISRLIDELSLTGSYDYMILDMDFSIEDNILDLYRKMHSVVFVSDGSESANKKTYRAYQAIMTKEQNREMSILNKFNIVYNKFSNKTSQILEVDIKNIGGCYYDKVRTATIVVTEHNFDAERVKINVAATDDGKAAGIPDISGWQKDGDRNITTVQFNNDSKYAIDITAMDSAGNSVTETISFSVNRFGSTYEFGEQAKAVNEIYVQKASDIVLTETNANEITNIKITLFKNNETIVLSEGEDYKIDISGGNGNWYQYTYTIYANNFEDDSP